VTEVEGDPNVETEVYRMEDVEKLVGHLQKVTPKTTAAMVDAELYELVTPEKHGSPFSFNMMKLAPKGIVKTQAHADQHGVFVHSGQCRILLGEKWVEVAEGGYVYIPPNLIHSFENRGTVSAEVLILKL
jgi:quercetin dioxygenase-like cupin family protein